MQQKQINTVVGHEITHVLEGTELYDVLQNMAIEFSKTKGDYGDRMIALRELYTGKYKNDADGDFEAKLRQELTADIVGEYLFTDTEFINRLSTEQPSLFKRIFDEIKYLCRVATAGSKEARELERVKKIFEAAYREGGKVTNSTQYSVENDVTVDMSEDERYNILKDKKIQPQDVEIDENVDIDFDYLENNIKSVVETSLLKKFKELKLFKAYKSVVVSDIGFDFTGKGFKKSLHSQKTKYGGSKADFAKVALNMQKLLDNAVLIDVHTDKGKGTNKEKRGLSQVFVLMSAMKEGNKIIPVQFEIMQYVNNENRLYLAVALTKIEIGVKDNTALEKQVATSLLPISDTYSIKDLFSKINTNDGRFLKYVPNQFLNEAQIEAKNRALEKDREKYSKPQYSLSTDSKGRALSKEQEKYFGLAKTRDEEGRLKPFYHGTGRADRVGTVFRPERATSGPMAYFTDNPEIADSYARNKKDPSISYDSIYDSYETQFRVNRNGKDISIVDLWYRLSMSERNAIKEKAKHITMDDDWENVIYSENAQYGLGNFDAYELNRHKGNVLHTLVDSWLTDGNIYGEEHKFLDVLKLVGVEDAIYMNPDFRDEKVYQVYLNITNPFNTSDISAEMLEALREAAKNADYNEGISVDLFDKRNVTPEQWIERLEDDIENGTTHTWTAVPDFVTDALKAHGYDGILDKGGTGGGIGHTVAIPFYSEQIKDIDNLNPTADKDISKSLSMEDTPPTRKFGQTYGEDVMLEKADDIAPVREDVARKPLSDIPDFSAWRRKYQAIINRTCFFFFLMIQSFSLKKLFLLSTLTFQLNMRVWRNWQTRQI